MVRRDKSNYIIQSVAHALDVLEEFRDDEKEALSGLRFAVVVGRFYEELARRMTVPLGTMKSMIRRGLLKLRACLQR